MVYTGDEVLGRYNTRLVPVEEIDIFNQSNDNILQDKFRLSVETIINAEYTNGGLYIKDKAPLYNQFKVRVVKIFGIIQNAETNRIGVGVLFENFAPNEKLTIQISYNNTNTETTLDYGEMVVLGPDISELSISTPVMESVIDNYIKYEKRNAYSRVISSSEYISYDTWMEKKNGNFWEV